MKPEQVFKRYDIRGSHPDEIDEEFAERLGKAVGTYASRHDRERVVLSYDTRESSQAIFPALKKGVESTGVEVVDIGVGPTDRCGLAASHYGGIGVMVTASHLAWEKTGFKLLYENGHGFSNEDLVEVKQLFRDGDFEEGTPRFVMQMEAEFDEEYVEQAHEKLEETGSGTIVLDCGGGSSFRVAPWLFDRLGFDVVEIDCTPGESRDPEPKQDNRGYVEEKMQEEDADLAVGFDPDADRVYAVHPEIGWIDGNELFYLLARLTGAEKIAASIDTSELIEELDAEIEYSRVGDVFVSALGVEMEADLLGEPNGHYAVTDFCWYNSGVYCAGLLALNHDRLPGLLEDVPQYFTERRVHRAESEEEKEEALQRAIKKATKNYEVVSTIDGVKFRGDGFSALVRPSGTSLKIRLIVNGRDENVVKKQADRLVNELF